MKEELRQLNIKNRTHDDSFIDPVPWLIENVDFHPYEYEIEFLRDYQIKRRIVRKSRQIGMTTTFSYEALFKALNFANRMILFVSPGQRQSIEAMEKGTRPGIMTNQKIQSRLVIDNRTEVKFNNGSRILTVPNKPQFIRGFTATDIYLDEMAFFFNDKQIMVSLKPMLLSGGSLTILSTPFGKRGSFYNNYQKAVQLQNKDPLWRYYDYYPSTIAPHITPEIMKEMIDDEDLSEVEARQEYYGEFIEEVDTFIPMEIISPCINHELETKKKGEPGHRYVLGVDFAKKRDESVLTFLERREDNVWMLKGLIPWTGLHYNAQLGRMRMLKQTWNVIGGYADQTGVGEALIEDVHKIFPGVQGVIFSSKTKPELAQTLRHAFEKHLIEIPNDKKLISQINSLRAEYTKHGSIVFKSGEGEVKHDDYLWSLALAVYKALHYDYSTPRVRCA